MDNTPDEHAPPELLARIASASPYYALLGMDVIHVEPRLARIRLPFRADLVQPGNVVHGGAVASLADSAMAVAIIAALPLGVNCATLELSTRFLAPVFGGDLLAEGRVVKLGRRVAVGTATVFLERDRGAAGGGATVPSTPGGASAAGDVSAAFEGTTSAGEGAPPVAIAQASFSLLDPRAR